MSHSPLGGIAFTTSIPSGDLTFIFWPGCIPDGICTLIVEEVAVLGAEAKLILFIWAFICCTGFCGRGFMLASAAAGLNKRPGGIGLPQPLQLASVRRLGKVHTKHSQYDYIEWRKGRR